MISTQTEIEHFDVRDGCLVVGGSTVEEIAADLGRTPFYVYDSSLIRKRIARLRANIPSSVRLHYAVKANPMPAVVDLVRGQVDGLDVASVGELEVALKSGMAPEEISFAGPGKGFSELERAVAAGITINAESPSEVERIADIARKTSRRPRVALRVNPAFELKSSGMQMAGGPKQFGIDDDQVPGVLGRMSELPVEFYGFHIFSGSQNLSAEAICEAQRQAVELALELAKHAPVAPRMLNIGGGFGIPYFKGDRPLDLAPIRDNLEKLQRRTERELPTATLMLELGRYIVGEAGVYVCRIVDRKVSRGRIFLICDGGLHHHLAASGNFGQVIRKNYPVVIANRIGSREEETASVVGPLCTPLDLLADRMQLARADVGDLVAVFQSGAYGFSASPHRFLSHPPPVEILK